MSLFLYIYQLTDLTSYSQVKKKAKEDGKTGYTTYKNVVWHEGVYEMLAELIQASHTGQAHMCGDDIMRILYPIILLLTADYEEQ